MTRALLLLMHQGRSFTREVHDAAARFGLSLVALSSRPEKPEDMEDSSRYLADCEKTDGSRLTTADVEGVVGRFAARGFAVEAVIATFEGYRLLMAELNEQLGAHDCAVAALALCLDKYELRRFLADRGLSMVRVQMLTVGASPTLDPAARWFVKPVRGASSFGAFLLEDFRALADVPELQRQMRADHRMSAIFLDTYDFVVEEYVDGPEFSFETVLFDGVWHLCVHEKARVERLERTTLEAMSVSPPVSIGADLVLDGADFLTRCLAELGTLGLSTGAFHIEAKYWAGRDRWEIIEINPRIGGSLIHASVQAVTNESLLELWVRSLLTQKDDRKTLREHLARVSQLEALRTGSVSRATVFLSRYGEKGRTVASIRFNPPERQPQVLKLHVQPGTTLEDSDRAICLMDALWEVDTTNLAAEVDFLDQHATEHFDVQYS